LKLLRNLNTDGRVRLTIDDFGTAYSSTYSSLA